MFFNYSLSLWLLAFVVAVSIVEFTIITAAYSASAIRAVFITTDLRADSEI